MGLETATYVDDLNTSNPDGAVDQKQQGDNHLRLIKAVLKNTFPGFTGRVGRVQSKGNYTAVLNDNFSLLFFTAAATLSLTAVSTLGNGWISFVYAGGGDVTVDANASEEINGSLTKVIKQGQMAVIFASGIAGDEFFMLYIPSNAEFTSLIQPTGVVLPYIGTTAPTGFVLSFGTIGSAGSAASNRANADTEPLYTLLWNSWDDAEAPVSSGRGANAAADFAANKTIGIPDLRGRAIFGQDDMGGVAASRITNAISGIDAATLGKTGGDQRSQQHTHTANVTDPGHLHSGGRDAEGVGVGAGWGGAASSQLSDLVNTGLSATSVTVTNVDSGAGASQNMPPALVMNFIVKL